MASPRLLVVMDDEIARGLLVTVLRALGHTVDAAADRAEAVRLIDRHAYALVLSALRMPAMEGPELVRVLEERRPLGRPGLIFVARSPFAPDLAHFVMQSAAPLLPWPAPPADITRLVARSLALVAA
jgi:CheY-like chemotaxis protein